MKKVLSIAFILQLMLSISACKNQANEEGAVEKKPENGILIEVSKQQFIEQGMRLDTLGRASFSDVISANGVIEVPPNNRATVNAFLGGYVKDIPLLVGDKVRKGQKLLTVENLEFLELQQRYLETGQRMKYLQAEYERQKQLYEEKINSKKVFMKAENEFQEAKIERQALEKKLRMIHIDPNRVSPDNLLSQAPIYSPIEGSVTRVFVNNGSHVSPDDPIMEIVNSDDLHLEIQIFEKDALQLEKGQRIAFRVPEHSDKVFRAEVYLIGKSVGTDRTVKVHAHLREEGETRFIPGMFVQAEIMAGEITGTAISTDGIAKIEEKTFVLKLIDENESTYTFRKIEVEIGEERNGFVSIDLPADLQDSRFLIGFPSSVSGQP